MLFTQGRGNIQHMLIYIQGMHYIIEILTRNLFEVNFMVVKKYAHNFLLNNIKSSL